MFRRSGSQRVFVQSSIPIPDILGAFTGIRFDMKMFDNNSSKKEAEKTLELEDGYSYEDLRKSYKKLVLKWHPDKHSNDKDKVIARKKFDKIKNAYNLLSNRSEPDNILKDFLNPDYEDEDDELDAEAEDLFDYLRNFNGSSDILSFGPDNIPQEPKESLNYRVRVSIRDIWNNKPKSLPIKEKYLLSLPLYYDTVSYENHENHEKYDIEEITVHVVDRYDSKFRRRGNSWDLETYYKVCYEDLSEDHIMKIDMPDGKTLDVVWKADMVDQIKDLLFQGFYLYDKGLPKPDRSRGKLWVWLVTNKDKKIDKKSENNSDNVKVHPEFASHDDWWKVPNEQRSMISDLSAHMRVNP